MLIALTGCDTAPRISAASDGDCYASLAEVSSHAAKTADSSKYAAAMTSLAGSLALTGIGAVFAEGLGSLFDENAPSVRFASPDSSVLQGALCDALNGLSGREITVRADSLAPKVRSAFERRYAQVKIRALEDARQRRAAIADSLAQFRVLSARLIQQRGWLGLEATIVLTVENGTQHPVSRAFFNGRVVSEGRSIPWIESSFNYRIAGGLEPGERATWRLSPNMFQGDWTSVTAPAGARLVVEVTKLEGAEGVPLWGGPSFTAGDQRLLDSLVAQFGPAQ